MGADRFSPTHEVVTQLSGDRVVRVASDGTRFGIQFRSGEVSTCAVLSDEAMAAMVLAQQQLRLGKGEPIKREWRVVSREEVLAREDASKAERMRQAAPDMKHALELALEYWAHRQQRYRNRHPVWVQEAKAALAKATPPAVEAAQIEDVG